mmetsp:Transcript_115360/g.327210  ORF Transcript_115360/g.327210 Transcript_115360/m.327210 type:complete len:424 (-) Transcript_115360:68-1339(-)
MPLRPEEAPAPSGPCPPRLENSTSAKLSLRPPGAAGGTGAGAGPRGAAAVVRATVRGLGASPVDVVAVAAVVVVLLAVVARSVVALVAEVAGAAAEAASVAVLAAATPIAGRRRFVAAADEVPFIAAAAGRAVVDGLVAAFAAAAPITPRRPAAAPVANVEPIPSALLGSAGVDAVVVVEVRIGPSQPFCSLSQQNAFFSADHPVAHLEWPASQSKSNSVAAAAAPLAQPTPAVRQQCSRRPAGHSEGLAPPARSQLASAGAATAASPAHARPTCKQHHSFFAGDHSLVGSAAWRSQSKGGPSPRLPLGQPMLNWLQQSTCWRSEAKMHSRRCFSAATFAAVSASAAARAARSSCAAAEPSRSLPQRNSCAWRTNFGPDVMTPRPARAAAPVNSSPVMRQQRGASCNFSCQATGPSPAPWASW